MKPSFFALFKRGKHVRQWLVEVADGIEGRRKRQAKREEAERFAVAAIAFCLKHDTQIRAHFLAKICGIQKPAKWRDAEIEVEEKQWGDLTIIHRGRGVFVVECKIRAPQGAAKSRKRNRILETRLRQGNSVAIQCPEVSAKLFGFRLRKNARFTCKQTDNLLAEAMVEL